jgi:hypothetical protein
VTVAELVQSLIERRALRRNDPQPYAKISTKSATAMVVSNPQKSVARLHIALYRVADCVRRSQLPWAPDKQLDQLAALLVQTLGRVLRSQVEATGQGGAYFTTMSFTTASGEVLKVELPLDLPFGLSRRVLRPGPTTPLSSEIVGRAGRLFRAGVGGLAHNWPDAGGCTNPSLSVDANVKQRQLRPYSQPGRRSR